MSETTPPSSTEKTVTVNAAQLCRLKTFTYISIGLNVVILALLAIGMVKGHHHKKNHGFRDRGCPYLASFQGGGFGGRGFHHHRGMMGMNRGGWGGPGMNGGFGQQGFMNRGPGPGMMGGNMGGGPGMGMNRGGGWGGPGGMGGGFGRRGMDGGKAPDPAAMSDMILNRLSGQLNLTDDQKAKIKPILVDQATQIQKDMEAQKAAREKAMADTMAKIKALLTPDQQKQFDAIPKPGQKPADAAAAAPAAK